MFAKKQEQLKSLVIDARNGRVIHINDTYNGYI